MFKIHRKTDKQNRLFRLFAVFCAVFLILQIVAINMPQNAKAASANVVLCKTDTLGEQLTSALFTLENEDGGYTGETLVSGAAIGTYASNKILFTNTNGCVYLYLNDGEHTITENRGASGYFNESLSETFTVSGGQVVSYSGDAAYAMRDGLPVFTFKNRIIGSQNICLMLSNGGFSGDTYVQHARLKITGVFDGRSINMSGVDTQDGYMIERTTEYFSYETGPNCAEVTDLPEGTYTVTQETDGYTIVSGEKRYYKKGSSGTFVIRKGDSNPDLTLYQTMRTYGRAITEYYDCNANVLLHTESVSFEIEAGQGSSFVPPYTGIISIPGYVAVSHTPGTKISSTEYRMRYCYEPPFGTLKITKKVGGSGATIGVNLFNINVSFTANGNDVSPTISSIDYTKSDNTTGSITLVNNVATVSLSNDEWIELTVPTAYVYDIEEDSLSSAGYTVTYTNKTGVTLGNTSDDAIVQNIKEAPVVTGVDSKIAPTAFIIVGSITSGFVLWGIRRLRCAKT